MRTRPRGVVSKNDMGDLRMFLSILEWRLRDAYTPAKAREKVLRNTKTICPALNTV